MPDYVKLPIGDRLTFQVKAVDTDTSGKWPDYHLTAMDGRIVVAPKAALDRQLERLTMTPIELVGHYITIERAPNKEDAKKSWWNLSLANKEEATAKPSKRPTEAQATTKAPDTRTAGQREFDAAVPNEDGPPAHHRDIPLPESEEELVASADAAKEAFAAKREAYIAGYLALYDRVALYLCDLGRANDFPVDATGINAATATINILLDKRNLL